MFQDKAHRVHHESKCFRTRRTRSTTNPGEACPAPTRATTSTIPPASPVPELNLSLLVAVPLVNGGTRGEYNINIARLYYCLKAQEYNKDQEYEKMVDEMVKQTTQRLAKCQVSGSGPLDPPTSVSTGSSPCITGLISKATTPATMLSNQPQGTPPRK
ncbi:hypothetical protein PtA15_10A330 [Puccinia triticina]|uniref:Uncharacterized protein n=1 Tax=Puccinia triticina TaxID=208348 RepID=A0ABY7CVG3_9BASI|nr:uncharacterized protein PtA15_10A330 [Puccinia triticina]WAQ88908.1 hypothetical protein PtA15_10A330 [Puccinia triticina]